MNSIFKIAIVPLIAALAVPCVAQAPAATASEIRSGRLVRTADGKRVGEIDKVVRDAQGVVQAVSVIHNGGFVSIPASTLTGSGSTYVTSLTVADLRKLR